MNHAKYLFFKHLIITKQSFQKVLRLLKCLQIRLLFHSFYFFIVQIKSFFVLYHKLAHGWFLNFVELFVKVKAENIRPREYLKLFTISEKWHCRNFHEKSFQKVHSFNHKLYIFISYSFFWGNVRQVNTWPVCRQCVV